MVLSNAINIWSLQDRVSTQHTTIDVGIIYVNISKDHFGTTPEGHDAFLFTLKGDTIEARITNYGGAITSIIVPDKDGNAGDVVLGYDTLAEYVNNTRYLGALIGRFANRIGEGKFRGDTLRRT